MSLLSVQNVGKAFRSYSSEWTRVARWFGLPIKPSEEHWVLRNVSFEIKKGETIGIIGQNGAGKSTLLKMITGTLQPTEGQIQVKGKIAAILELGMGFNPDLTGRGNAYHGLGLMGYSHAEIEQVMPELEAFAEVGEYFDQPIRVYSSGMQMRVAFAVVTAFRPEILIVDEALSVGDSYFQHKCFTRIQAIQNLGTSLLIVSHDKNAIQKLCDRAILFERGNIIRDGKPETIFDYYNAIIAEKENSKLVVNELENGREKISSGTGEAVVQEINIYNIKGEKIEAVAVGEQIELQVRVKVFQPIETLVFGYAIKDRLGQEIYGTNTWYTDQVASQLNVGDEYVYRISFPAFLGIGSYSISTALTSGASHLEKNYEWRDLALLFNVINMDKPSFIGLTWLNTSIIMEKIN